VGLASTLVDICVYSLVLLLIPGQFFTAKGVGFLAGTATGFGLNKSWTFQNRDSKLKTGSKYLLLYAFALLLNTVTNQFGLGLLGRNLFGLVTSFAFATTASSIANFLGLRFFVFRRSID
jgi:putative flippase GtrA